jgi:hypothetical protein
MTTSTSRPSSVQEERIEGIPHSRARHQAHAEAIKRFYEDKAFAVKAYVANDRQDPAEIGRVYDRYFREARAGPTARRGPIRDRSGGRLVSPDEEVRLPDGVDRSTIDRLVREGSRRCSALRSARSREEGPAGIRAEPVPKLTIDRSKRYWLERETRDVLAFPRFRSVQEGEFVDRRSERMREKSLNVVAGFRRRGRTREIDGKAGPPRWRRGLPAPEPPSVAHGLGKREIRMEMQRRFDARRCGRASSS